MILWDYLCEPNINVMENNTMSNFVRITKVLPTKEKKAKISINYSLGQEHFLTLNTAVTRLRMQID